MVLCLVAVCPSRFLQPDTPSWIIRCRYDLENKVGKDDNDAARIKTLYGEFGRWHGASAVTNLGIVCASFAHGWFLSSTLAL